MTKETDKKPDAKSTKISNTKIDSGKPTDELDEDALNKVSGGAPPFHFPINDGKHGPH